MKNRKMIMGFLFIGVIAIFGITFAYFGNLMGVVNEFKTNPYGSTVTEQFVSPTNWKPGDTTEKTLIVENTGSVDEAVRVSYTELWKSKNGTTLSGVQNNNVASIINWENINDWVDSTENGTLYKYYKYKVAPGESTSTLLNSVTFNSAITNDSNCNTVIENNVRTITCSSSGAGYDGATYTLIFKVETIQYQKYKDAWETSVNILEEKPGDPSIYSSHAISGLTVGSVIDPNNYQTGYSEEDTSSVHMKYVVDENYTVIALDLCKKETANSPGICVEENAYNKNLNTVLSYFGGDINNMPNECSIDDNYGTEELTCVNDYVVIGVDSGGGLFVNDLENKKSCVVNSLFGIYSCK